MGDDILERFVRINVWQQKGVRAPHKPLLILLALARLREGRTELPFVEYETKFKELFREFGPSRKTIHPEYPFWRLQNDELWRVEVDRSVRRRRSNTDVPRSELIEADARGHFPPDIASWLLGDPDRIRELANMILEAHFPRSLHEDILSAVGLDSTADPVAVAEDPGTYDIVDQGLRRKRDPNFRQAVLTAYQFRCAVCGFDIRIGNQTVGLEAAHIKWHQASGPSEVCNGLTLCSIHHKLFDFGAFTLQAATTGSSSSPAILISEHINGSGRVD